MSPNAPRTPTTTHRLPAPLRDAVQTKAARRGETATALVVGVYEAYRDLSDEVLDALKAKAATQGETVTDVVRRALREYVEEET